jgi:hypothetical protein
LPRVEANNSSFTAAGGAQDTVLARCHQAAQLARRHAGLVLSTDPASAQIAVEIRKQATQWRGGAQGR